MASTKISALTAGAPALATDLFPIARTGSNFSLRMSDLLGGTGASSLVYSLNGVPTQATGMTFSSGAIAAITAQGPVNVTPAVGTSAAYETFNNTGGTLFVGLDNDAANVFGTGGGYGSVVYRPAATTFAISRGATVDELVSATGTFKWPAYGAGALTTDGSGNITAVSDETQKRNIRPFARGLKEILQLMPILHGYSVESGLDQTRDDYAGFGAAAVQKVIPEAVGKMADQVEPEFITSISIDSKTKERTLVKESNPKAGKLIKAGALTLNPFVILAAVPNAVRELQDQITVLTKRLDAAGIK